MCEGWPERFVDGETQGGHVRFEPPISREAARWWNTRFRTGLPDRLDLYPENFVDIIAKDAPGAVRACFRNLDYEAETFKVEIKGFEEDRTEIFYKAKRFEMTDAVANEGETRVAPDRQGAGIGTGLMINLIELGCAIGLERIDVDAQDIGRYVWITMGFLPDATSWRRFIVPEAEKKLRLLLALCEITMPTFKSASEILRQPDPRAIRDILLLDENVSGSRPLGNNGDVALLSALMLQEGTDWAGSFDFNERAALDLFRAYKEAHDVDHPRPW